MGKEKKICPMMLSSMEFASSQGSDLFCLKEQCQWWVYDDCSIVSIVKSLVDIMHIQELERKQ